MRKITLFICFFMVSHAYGAQWHTSKINMVYPQENGDFTLRLDNATANCENNSKFYKVVVGEQGVTEEGVKALLGSALAAASQGLEVNILWEPKDGQCYVRRFKVNY